jgi:hypothetical protein
MNESPKSENPHLGGSLDDFLKQEGTFEEVARAINEVANWRREEPCTNPKNSKKGGTKSA